MPPGSGLQLRARAPHSPARAWDCLPSRVREGRDSELYVTYSVTNVNDTVTSHLRHCWGVMRSDRDGGDQPDHDQTTPASLDHFICARDYGRRHRGAERIGGFEVDRQLELARLLDRDIGDFDAA